MMPRKPVDLAIALLCAGILLLMPPFILIFNKPILVLGVPLPALYVFGVWFALVVIAALLRVILPHDTD